MRKERFVSTASFVGGHLKPTGTEPSRLNENWEATGTVEDDATSFQEQPGLAEQQTDSRISIVAAVTAYLSDAKARNLSEATVYKLKIIFEKQFVSWCAHKGLPVSCSDGSRRAPGV
jgi:hypothetical protein